jgi:PPK2 family polyphosphate:nucleotide phosphotransferase
MRENLSVRDRNGLVRLPKSVRKRFAVTGDGFTLAAVDPGDTSGAKDKAKARAFVESLRPCLTDWQTRLYADRRQSLLVVLQGMDACGKDGVIKHVVDLFYPTSVKVTSFKAPTDEEKRHNFLWRFRPVLPSPGNIMVWNRSHYEDVGTVKVHELASPQVIERRYGEINRFEQEAADNGVRIIKCFLHVSQAEQRQRMLDRLADPTKRWKFKASDLDESDRWMEYMAAYDVAIQRCSTDIAPWYVVPADHKWYRDWVVSQLVLEWFEQMNPQYPAMAELDLPALRGRIKASGRVAT